MAETPPPSSGSASASSSSPSSSNGPWLVAAWPGMGNVAVGAAAYLVEELGAKLVHELPAVEFFEPRHIEVSKGVAKAAALPRSMFFEWRNPAGGRDLLIFVGEAQPQAGGAKLCRHILEFAQQRRVSRIFTFAAMATQLHPSQNPRAFGVATHEWMLPQLQEYEVELLQQGQIAGLNGLLLATATQMGLPAACLLGELPFFAAGVQNPRASLAVLKVFCRLSGIDVDFTRLNEAGREVEQALLQLLEQLKEAARQARGEQAEEATFETAGLGDGGDAGEDAEPEEAPPPPPPLDEADRARIESLFEEAHRNREKAFQLKEELDRLGVFQKYEDRFLDLFTRGE